jgi:N-acylneuraminate cytidylyltransferase
MQLPAHLRDDLYRLLPEEPALLALDFDGVLTDDRVYVSEDGREMVACTRGDGLGITLLRRASFPVLVISTEPNPVVSARCAKLGIECLQDCRKKADDLARFLRERGIPRERLVFVGNDINDIGCLRLAGCGLAVADAHPLVKEAAAGVLSHPGGRGAVREVAEMLIVRLGREIVY